MSNEITEFVSFWGGIASIVALLVSMVGGFIFIIKKLRSRHKKEIKALEELQGKVREQAKSATTQAKKLDLFIYYQNLLSSRQNTVVVDEIQKYSIHIISLIIIMFFAGLDSNANYYIDQISGKSELFYNNFGIFLSINVILLGIANLLIARESSKYKKIVTTISEGLTLEFKKLQPSI